MRNYLIALSTLVIISSSCEKNEPSTTSTFEAVKVSSGLDLKSLEGLWVLSSTKIGFPSNTPKVQVTTSEKYQFVASGQTYERYVDGVLVEEGTFKIGVNSNNKTIITFSHNESSATIFFENGELVIGTRVPKGQMLIDYEDYQYFSLKK